MLLTQQDLNKMVCAVPGCTEAHTEIVLHARCHPESGTFAWYNKDTGCLTIRCAECEEPTAEIAVASGPN